MNRLNYHSTIQTSLHDINSSVNYQFACTRNLNFILRVLPEKNTAQQKLLGIDKMEIIPYHAQLPQILSLDYQKLLLPAHHKKIPLSSVWLESKSIKWTQIKVKADTISNTCKLWGRKMAAALQELRKL